MSVLTLLMCLFTVVLYLFLFVVRKDIQVVAVSRKGGKVAIALFSLVIILVMLFTEETFDNRLRGIVSGLLFLSFVFDSRGLAEDRLIIHPLNIRGILYQEVDRVVLYQESKDHWIKMNFFRRGIRGPMLKFDRPMEELVLYLTEHLKEGTPIDVLVDQEPKDH
jgi:hypothetical protein